MGSKQNPKEPPELLPLGAVKLYEFLQRKEMAK
jgi:hypothetical protein